MYYNIKIKSNGSEFSLESNNKEVLQREMDLYFATIFNVSEEFKSNIKKIEVTNKNVKSIDEVEIPKNIEKTSNQLSEEKIQELAKIKAQEIIEAHKAKIAQEEKLKFELQNSLQQMPSNVKLEKEIEKPQPIQEINSVITEVPILEQNNQNLTSVVKFQNEPIPTQISQPEVTQIPSKLPDEILELINLAQKKIESIEKINTPDITLNKPQAEIKEENKEVAPSSNEIVSETERNNQVKLDDIFNLATPSETTMAPIQEPAIETPQTLQEFQVTNVPTTETIQTPQEPIFNDTMEVSLADIEVSLQPQEIYQDTPNEEDTKMQPLQTQIEQPQIEPDIEETKPTETARIPLSQIASQIDFKPFLSGFICDGLSDEFLICAYFIKNVLKQSDFTMKFINSKLFQATGKIADMSVIDELTTKEYIRTIDSEDGKKYCITMDGEGYFATKFQG